MSVEHMAIVINHSRLSGAQRTVLMILANHHGENGAWPSIQTLARGANCSERTVQRAIAAAVEAGELEVRVQDGGTHHTRADRRPNRYFLTLACPADCDGSPNHRRRHAHNVAETAPPRGDAPVTPQQPRGDTDATPSKPRGDTGVANGVTQVSPKPLEEPLLLPSVSPETTDRASTGPTDRPDPAIDEPDDGGADAPAADPRLSDPGFLRFLAAVVPAVRRPERFTWPPGELDALEARYRSPNPFGSHHAQPTPIPPRFDPAVHGPPPDAIPMPDHIRQALRRPA